MRSRSPGPATSYAGRASGAASRRQPAPFLSPSAYALRRSAASRLLAEAALEERDRIVDLPFSSEQRRPALVRRDQVAARALPLENLDRKLEELVRAGR